MKNKISDTIRNYFNEMIKNIPKLEWKDDKNNNSLICSTSTQFGNFTIKRYYDKLGYYALYLNDNPASPYSKDVNELMNRANLLYRQETKIALKI